MPVITALEAHRLNAERVKLYLDDEYALDVPLLQAAKLRRGQCLTEAEVQALADAEADQRAYDRAVRYLSYRPRSAEEVRRHLAKKDVPAAAQATVLARLRQQGYIDDAAFVAFWLADRERFKPLAPRALRYELRQKGVADDIIEAQLTELDASASAYRAASKRLHRYRGGSLRAFQQQLSAFLRRRGFNGDTVADVVWRLQQELQEADSGYFREQAEDCSGC